MPQSRGKRSTKTSDVRKGKEKTAADTLARTASRDNSAFSKGEGGSKSVKAKSGVTRRKELDVEEVNKIILEVSEYTIFRLGLEGLFNADDVREIVEDYIQSLLDEGRRINRESIVKKLEYRKENIYKHLAVKTLQEGRELTEELAEFIVYRAPEIAGRAAPQLYRALENNETVLEILRHLWETYGKPTPLKCPICRFKSLTPELACLICNRTSEEEVVKKANNFEEELKHAIRGWHRRLIEEALQAGYVYFDGEVKPPSMAKPGGLGALITLNTREKLMLREYLVKTAT